jgi:hypothetical protein
MYVVCIKSVNYKMSLDLKKLNDDERKEYNNLMIKKIHASQYGNNLSGDEDIKLNELVAKATPQIQPKPRDGGRRRPKSSNKRSIRRRSSKARQSRKSRSTRRR